MNGIRVHRLADSPPGAEEYHLPADKLIAGNPRQTVWRHDTDLSMRFVVGLWRSEVGKWHIAYTEEEFCHMLEGTSVITDSDGHAVTLTAGESFVVPSGFVGTWEVVEPTTKRFVIYEAAPVPQPS